MVAVTDGVVLEHELTREGRVGVERHRRGSVESLVAEGSDRRGSRCAVLPKQIERRLQSAPSFSAAWRRFIA
jgi:hypothetical protein